MKRFVVIGITDRPQPWFPPEIMEAIRGGRVFSGGRRHHEIVAPLLPPGAIWIDITGNLDHVFAQYTADEIVVFASGDPWFFGFANTIRRRMPDAEMEVWPAFNSLQMLAHQLEMGYEDMRVVSLTGRDWPALDRALIEGAGKIGVLTDRTHSPAAIARRMLEYGYCDYRLYVGEHLGNPVLEKVTELSLEEAARSETAMPNCVMIVGERLRRRQFGIPDKAFTRLDGRDRMITKMPVRLLALQKLELATRRVLWDIGFCTGSVSIEARRMFPHLQVVAFEIRRECEAIIQENARKMGTPGIDIHIGDFMETDLADLPRPDAVFIGGHGGRLKEMMARVLTAMTDDGVIVMNSVVAPKVITDSRKLWTEACMELGLRQEPPLHVQIDDNHPITILKCKR